MSSPASYSGQSLDPVSARYSRRTSRPWLALDLMTGYALPSLRPHQLSPREVAWSPRSGARRVLKRGEQLTVQVGVGVQATALIARMSSGSISETAARFLDEKDPWRVIPNVVPLDQEGIDLATNKLDERQGAGPGPRQSRDVGRVVG